MSQYGDIKLENRVSITPGDQALRKREKKGEKHMDTVEARLSSKVFIVSAVGFPYIHTVEARLSSS